MRRGGLIGGKAPKPRAEGSIPSAPANKRSASLDARGPFCILIIYVTRVYLCFII